jgi:hypothetical protein
MFGRIYMEITNNQLEELKSGLNICVDKKLNIRDYTLKCGKEKIKVSCTQWWSTFGGYKSSLTVRGFA